MNLSELQSQVRFLTNTDSTTYPDADINANLTRWAHLLTTEILDSQEEWDFQGEIATTDLVAGQQEYVFPKDILKIKRVEVSYDGKNWYVAQTFDISERTLSATDETGFSKTNPFVELYDNSLFLYPTPDADVENGLKIWYSEEIVGKDANGNDITHFSNPTDRPNIAEAFQRALVLGAVKDWAQAKQLWDLFKSADNEQEKIIIRMRQFYGSRTEDRNLLLKTYSDLDYFK